MSNELPPRRRDARRLDLVLVVAIGGALGTLGRYELALAMPTASGSIPWAVVLANVIGTLVLGILGTVVLVHPAPPRYARPLVGVGFCGGLTTFSTWTVGAVQLADHGHGFVALEYVGAMLVAGVLSVLVGVALARAFLGRKGPVELAEYSGRDE